jgi:hypothetical protein
VDDDRGGVGNRQWEYKFNGDIPSEDMVGEDAQVVGDVKVMLQGEKRCGCCRGGSDKDGEFFRGDVAAAVVVTVAMGGMK